MLLLVLMFAFLAAPSFAMLRVLEEGLSAELRGIAKQEIHAVRNIPLAELSVKEAWVREYFSIDRSVYMVTVVHRDTSFEVPVDVADKKVLSETDLKSLDEEDRAKSSQGEPIMRAMTAVDTTTETVAATDARQESAISPAQFGLGIAGVLGVLSLFWYGVKTAKQE